MSPLALRPTLQHYDWGSPRRIPAFLGQPADGQPVAELWLGAHPAAPALAAVGEAWVPLDQLVAADPEAHLGRATRLAQGRVPFLLKLLAADRALSLQAHPDALQAAAGFLDEETRGVPLHASHRCYRDPLPKPELLCALSPFDALCGLRPTDESARELDEAGAGAVAQVLRSAGALAALDALWSMAADEAGALVAAAAERHPLVARLAGDHPGDVGSLAALLLHPVHLAPGDALYLPARTLHAYLGGFGVEVMASSDNVLRGGLTSKHTDPAELRRVLDDRPQVPLVLRPDASGTYRPPTEWFALQRLTVRGTARLGPGGPALVLALSGRTELGGLVLTPGQGAWVPAAGGPPGLGGDGEIAVARLPEA